MTPQGHDRATAPARDGLKGPGPPALSDDR